MPEQLLTILKFLLLALLYLFFLRVLRAVWTEVREPAVATPAAGPAAAPARTPRARRRTAKATTPTHLVVVAPPERAGPHHPLAAEMTIGRSPGCTIVVDDGFVSSVHTRISGRDGSFTVEDLGSTNGTYINRRKATGPTVVRVGDRIRVGNVELEVR